MRNTLRVLILLAFCAWPTALFAQRAPGKPIGKVKVIGNLIHLELDAGAVTPERLFDLDHRTLRYTPDGAGYRIENVPLKWDPEFGEQLTGNTATLRNFTFPFSGQSWDSFNVGTGAVTFGEFARPAATGLNARAGFRMERYPTLQTVGRTFINMIPGIAAMVKPSLSGQRYVKELADRAVVTWTLTETVGSIQAFTWVPTVNRIQAVLHKNGVIEVSYNDVSARDAVVGVFPLVRDGADKVLGKLADGDDAAAAPHLDIKNVTLTAVDGVFLEATLETRGSVLPNGDSALSGVTYRIAFNDKSGATDLAKSKVVWTIRGVPAGRGNPTTRYIASGNGAEPDVTVSGNTIAIKGILPIELSGAKQLLVSADAGSGTPAVIADNVTAKTIALGGFGSPEIDLSAVNKSAGPFTVAYEGFHWSEIPRAQDLACSVITALGDRFDFIASYSDFRVDNPEGGTPSTGPRGGNVSGIGSSTNGLENFCSKGQLQFMFVEPVSTSAVQIQERSPDGRMTDYNYAVSQIGHELGHRWAASASARVNGETIPLGPTHWSAGVHLPAAFPYGRPEEADLMGGSTWKDNGDGTYTQLDRDFYNPAKGWSWLALYLMGLAKPEEVPPFFILRNLQRTGQTDANGKPIFKGDKVVITINDVIAAMGPRTPSFENSQKNFNTAIVVVTNPGKQPTPELLKAANDISRKWIEFWARTTGGRSVMTVKPN